MDFIIRYREILNSVDNEWINNKGFSDNWLGNIEYILILW